MEIKIRTHEELRADRVTIEITGTGAEVRRYTDGEVAHLQASEAELVAQPLRARIVELEENLAREEAKVHAFNLDRHTERDRADRERQRASELKDRLSTSEERVAELENEVAALTRKIDAAQDIIHGSQVQEAMESGITRHTATLATALQDVSNTLA